MTTPSPSPTDEQRRLIRECADLFFSEAGTVHENVMRVAAAAFRAGASIATPAPAPDGWMPIETASQTSEHAKKD